jgi:hypothetical protein
MYLTAPLDTGGSYPVYLQPCTNVGFDGLAIPMAALAKRKGKYTKANVWEMNSGTWKWPVGSASVTEGRITKDASNPEQWGMTRVSVSRDAFVTISQLWNEEYLLLAIPMAPTSMHINDTPSGLELAMSFTSDPVSGIGPAMEISSDFLRPRIGIRRATKTLIELEDNVRVTAKTAKGGIVTDQSGLTKIVGMVPGSTILEENKQISATGPAKANEPPKTAEPAASIEPDEQAKAKPTTVQPTEGQ